MIPTPSVFRKVLQQLVLACEAAYRDQEWEYFPADLQEAYFAARELLEGAPVPWLGHGLTMHFHFTDYRPEDECGLCEDEQEEASLEENEPGETKYAMSPDV